jgi:general secretion pathway protein A
VARALKNPDAVPTYLEFFGMSRPPFSKLTGPTPIFHSEQYSLLMSHLASGTERSDSLIVVCGADGSGKTTLLNRYIAGLNEDVCYAAFDETCADGTQFYLAFLRQLGFSDIAGKLRELRRITREFVIHRAIAGDPVLVIIDNAHLISPAVLEQLRWICETKVDDRRVLSVVLAGNNDLPRIMESPAMRLLKFRTHISFNIRVFTEAETEDYIRHRLRLAGGVNAVKFSSEAHPLIYRFTGGVPNTINMLCNAVFTEACALETRVITEELIRAVADRHQLLPHVVPLQGKGRRKTDPDIDNSSAQRQAEERITARETPPTAPIDSSATATKLPDIDVESLLEKISQLSEQLGESRSLAKQAQLDVGARDEEISNLREKLEARTADIERSVAADDRVDEISRLNQALSDSAKQLQESEDASKKLADDLTKEKSAAKNAAAEAAKAEAKIAEQDRVKSESQATVRQLKTDLKLANKRVASLDHLEKDAAALKDDIEEKSAQLKSRDDKLAELEKSLQESRDECASLRSSADALKNRDDSEMAKHISELNEQLKAQKKQSEQLAATVGGNADEIQRLNEALAESEKALANKEKALSDSEKVLADKEKALSDGEKTLADKEKALSDSEKALADKEKALSDNEKALADKEKALADSEKTLADKEKALAESEIVLADKEKALSESKKALTDKDNALQKSDDAASELADALKKEKSATTSAESNAAKANTRVDKLERTKSELQKSVSDLTSELRELRERSEKINSLEKATATLKEEVEENEKQLRSRDEMLASLKTSLQESQNDCEALRSSVGAVQELEKTLSERDARIANLEADLASYSNLDTSIQPQLLEDTASHPETPKPDVPAARPDFTIEIIKGGKLERVVDMTDVPSRIMIGRGDDCELRLDSKFVSRHHALVFCTPEGVCIEDLNSFNGTIVNSKKITRCNLYSGDKILVGDYQLRPRKG